MASNQTAVPAGAPGGGPPGGGPPGNLTGPPGAAGGAGGLPPMPWTPEQLATFPHDHAGPRLLAAMWPLLALAALFLGLRLYCKISRHNRLWWDDYLLIASWVSLPRRPGGTASGFALFLTGRDRSPSPSSPPCSPTPSSTGTTARTRGTSSSSTSCP